jgi:tetratricopeptide (TPR) repeat protein
MTTLALLVVTAALSAPAAIEQRPQTDQERRDRNTHYQLGREYLAAEQFEKAVAEFGAAIKIDALFTDAHYAMGRAYMGLQRYVSAIQAYQGCLQAAEQLHGLANSDRVAHDRRIDDEIRAMREAIVNVRRQKTGGVENQVLQLEARLRELERSRSSVGDVFVPPAEVLLALGSAHFRNGDAANAETNWAAATKSNPKLGEAWNNLAVIYMQTGRRPEAEQAVKKAESAGFRVNPRLKDDIRAMKTSGAAALPSYNFLSGRAYSHQELGTHSDPWHAPGRGEAVSAHLHP